MDASELTAAEAAARLGVKRETLYAYVSRGLVHRHLAMDGRTSLFDAAEIDAFRAGRRRSTEGEFDTVIATGLTRVADGSLTIRGRDLPAMAAAGDAYADVVAWLWDAADAAWPDEPSLADQVTAAIAALPAGTRLIDRLHVGLVVASATDPLRSDSTTAGMHTAGRRAISAMIVAAGDGSQRSAIEPVAELWRRLGGRRTPMRRRSVLNTAMVLLVDHGLASSTLAVRVAASVRADPYSALGAGLGVVAGSLHGAASAQVHRMLAVAAECGDAAAAVGEVQRTTGRAPGFGHAVYRDEDPRYRVLMSALNDAWIDDPRLGVIHDVRDIVAARSDLAPNVDLGLGALTWLSGMEPEAGDVIFAIARSAGWIAHFVEEHDEQPLRFRTRARYVPAMR